MHPEGTGHPLESGLAKRTTKGQDNTRQMLPEVRQLARARRDGGNRP